jgi:hypothetical protein
MHFCFRDNIVSKKKIICIINARRSLVFSTFWTDLNFALSLILITKIVKNCILLKKFQIFQTLQAPSFDPQKIISICATGCN